MVMSHRPPSPAPHQPGLDQAANLITGIVRQLVTAPDQVRVDVRTSPERTTLDLQVAPDDIGLVLGTNGRTVRSLQSVLAALSVRFGYNVDLEVIKSN